jgi:ABC-type phosphate transport system ATPase subunit
VILVTHNLKQATRVSEMIVFMYLGEIAKFDKARISLRTP